MSVTMSGALPQTVNTSNSNVRAGAMDDRGRVLSFIIFAALLALVVLTPIPYGTVERWWNSLFAIVVFALTTLWLIDYAFSRVFLTRQQLWLVIPLFALTLYALIQTIPFTRQVTPVGPVPQAISVDRYETKLFLIRMLALSLALAMLLRYASTRDRLLALAYAVIAIVLASSVFGLVRQIYQYSPRGFLLPALEKNSGYGQFINKNHFALLAEMGLGLLFGLIAGRAVTRSRSLIYLAVALPVWTALVLSNSRGGLLAMLSQLVFVVLLMNIHARKRTDESSSSPRSSVSLALRLMLAVGLAVTIVIGIIWIGGEPLANRLRSAREELTSQSVDTAHADRASIWRATLRLCRDHPFTGIGFGGYWIAINRYHEGSGQLAPQQAHNDYLEMAASGGIIGVALLVSFLVIFVRQTLTQLRSDDRMRRALALGAATGVFGVAVHSLVDFGLHMTGNAVVCVALIVIATREID